MSGDASTTRTLKLAGGLKKAVSGSRDGANLIWNMETVVCIHVLEGYHATVRYLDVQGDVIVTGSYDGI